MLRSRSGFTLLEIVISVLIASLVLFLAVGPERALEEKYQSEAVARELALQLLKKKREASTTGISAGLAFPGTGTFAAQAYYHINGLGTLRIKKGRSWQSEYPNAYATWAAFGSETVPAPGSEPGSLMPDLPTEDPAILFLPSGKVVTRGVSLAGETFRIRVGTQPDGSGAGTSGTALNGLNHAWTVTLNRNGLISVEVDPTISSSSARSAPTTASLPAPTALTTTQPILESLTTVPELYQQSDGTLRLNGVDQNLQIKAVAESPQGEPLSVRWQCDGGQFSHTGDWLLMTYSLETERWEASTIWSLPPSPGSAYKVSVEIKDPQGNKTTGSSAQELSFDVEPKVLGLLHSRSAEVQRWQTTNLWGTPGRDTILWASWLEGMRPDGTSAERVTEKQTAYTIPNRSYSVSPDGELVVEFTGNGIEFTGINGERVALVSSVGSLGTGHELVSWLPDSTGVLLVVRSADYSSHTLWEVRIDGSAGKVSDFPLDHELFRPSASDHLTRVASITHEWDYSNFSVDLSNISSSGQNPYLSKSTASVYDRATKQVKILCSSDEGPNISPSFVRLSPSGNRALVHLHGQDKVRLYNVNTGAFKTLPYDVFSWPNLAFSPDEKHIVVPRNASVSLISDNYTYYNTALVLCDIDGNQVLDAGEYFRAVFSPTGSHLYFSRMDGTLAKINLGDMSLEELIAPSDKVYWLEAAMEKWQ